MQLPWQNIQGFSGAAAVGALVLVDFTLIADAFATNLFPAINLYAQTPTWAVIVAVPLVALVYLLGVLSIGGGDSLLAAFGHASRITLADEASFLSACSELLATRFQQLRQEAELLAGSFVVFTLLSLGSLLHAVRIPGWRRFLISVAIAAVVFAALSMALAVRRYRSAHAIARPSRSHRPPTGP